MSLRLLGSLILVVSTTLTLEGQAPAQSSDTTTTPKGIIRGVVTVADTGKPIRGVDVRVEGGDLPRFEPRWALTDGDGRYEIQELKAGRYVVSAMRAGYLAPGSSLDTLHPVEVSESTPQKVDLSLKRPAVITARITDSFGEAVRGVRVQAFQRRFVNGRRQMSVAVGANSSVTDDRGETRIFGLPAGEYYIAAAPGFAEQWRGEAETFHPGTLAADDAQRVSVEAGEELFVTFPMVRAQLGSISGQIITSTGQPLSSPYASLAHPALYGGSSRRLTLAADGSFHEENLPPGDWVITVNEPEYGEARVRLFGEDIAGLVVTTRKAATVHGRVTFEGGPAPKESIELGVAFEGTPPMIGLSAGFIRSGSHVGTIEVTPDERWSFDAQISGTGVVRVRRAPGWLLKAIRVDGEDVADTMLDFGSKYDGKSVEVVLTQRKSEVSGTVADDRGQAVTNYVVLAFPQDEGQWTPSSRFIAAGRPDQRGGYAISGLPPGAYRIVAVDSIEPGAERDPDTLNQLVDRATELSLSEGETRSMNLRLVR